MFKLKPKIAAVLKSLPERPGVYIMRDAQGTVIYVGKAIKLKRRVSSYFRHADSNASFASPRLRKLVATVDDISTIRTETEAEALIVEAKLIKRYQPFFNVDLKLNDRYPWIKITNENFPRLEITRHKSLIGVQSHNVAFEHNGDIIANVESAENAKIEPESVESAKSDDSKSNNNDGDVYLGPFVNAGALKELMRLVERYFPLRVCKTNILKPDPNKRPCIEYSLGRCMGVCAGLCTQSEYRERVSDIILLFEGNTGELISRLHKRMDECARALKFEDAAYYRDTIKALWRVSRQRVSSALEQDLDNAAWEILNAIQKTFKLPVIPWRIDAFDISHTSGHDTYGCCIVFEQGRPNPSLYRKFKIRELADGEIDDFRSIYETVRRRYKHMLDHSEPLPQMALIDGGPVQLEFAQKALDEIGLDLPLIALAEREEEIYLPSRMSPIPNSNSSSSPALTPLRLGLDDPVLQMMQRLRDEVHRFAITTHRHARNARMKRSSLEDIPGIGHKRAAQLLVKFGSISRIAALPLEELARAPGIGLALAKQIKNYLEKF